MAQLHIPENMMRFVLIFAALCALASAKLFGERADELFEQFKKKFGRQ